MVSTHQAIRSVTITDYTIFARSTYRFFLRSTLDMLRRQRGLLSPGAAFQVFRYGFKKKDEAFLRSMQVNLLLTRRCNLNCSFCCVDKLSGSEGSLKDYEVSLDIFKSIFEHPVTSGCLSYVLMGGEPLLNKHLEAIIQFLKRKGRFSRVITNGLKLDASRLSSLDKAGVSQIIISMYDANRSSLSEAMHSSNTKVPIYLSKVLLKSDLENRYDDLISELGICRLPTCRGLLLSHCMSYGSNDQREMFFEDDALLLKFYKDISRLYPEVPISFPLPVLRNTGGRKKKCSIPWNTLYLDAKGNLGMCCKFQAHPNGKFGNIFSGNQEEQMAGGSILKTLRKNLLSSDAHVPAECLNCQNLYDDCSLRMLFDRNRLEQ